MPIKMQVTGLDELQARFSKFPQAYNRNVKLTLRAALLTLWENVPSYPSPPPGSTYERTGTLGRSLGGGEQGGKGFGEPDIYEIAKQGERFMHGDFGTRLKYAPFVIGDYEQAERMSYWWTIKDIAIDSKDKIVRLFQQMVRDLARFLDGKGML